MRTDKEVEGKDGKTLLSDKAIFLSASEKNSSLLSAGCENFIDRNENYVNNKQLTCYKIHSTCWDCNHE